MIFPSLDQVRSADKLTLGRWVKDLEEPRTPDDMTVLKEICARFNAKGGFDLKTIRELFPSGNIRLDCGETFESLLNGALNGF